MRSITDRTSEFVARFFGENNLIPGVLGEMMGETRAIETDLGRCYARSMASLKSPPCLLAAQALAACRPEAVIVDGAGAEENRIECHSDAGGFCRRIHDDDAQLRKRLLALCMRARMQSRPVGYALTKGDAVTLAFSSSACRVVPA